MDKDRRVHDVREKMSLTSSSPTCGMLLVGSEAEECAVMAVTNFVQDLLLGPVLP